MYGARLSPCALRLRAVVGLLIVGFGESCATPRALTADQADKAPILGERGALSPSRDERLVDQRLDPAQDTVHVRELIEAFREQSATPLIAGNRVAPLIDGPQTLAAIRRAIEEAQHHIHVETYIFADDEIGREFRDLLIRRRQQGVEVRVLYDAIGSVDTPTAFFAPMLAAGVEVREFRPLSPAKTPLPWKSQQPGSPQDRRRGRTHSVHRRRQHQQHIRKLLCDAPRSRGRTERSLARYARADRRTGGGAVSGPLLRDLDTGGRRDRRQSKKHGSGSTFQGSPPSARIWSRRLRPPAAMAVKRPSMRRISSPCATPRSACG